MKPPIGVTVGKVCNVRRLRAGEQPMPRFVISAKFETRGRERWYVWRWQPGAQTPEGRVDCGYSSVRVSA